jgi:hypothetical protein
MLLFVIIIALSSIKNPYFALLEKSKLPEYIFSFLFQKLFSKMSASETTVEFAVNLTCSSCVQKTEKVLKDVPGISDFSIDLVPFSLLV